MAWLSRLSLRARLAFGLTLAMGGVWILAMVLSAFILRHEVAELSSSVLALTAERMLPLALEQETLLGDDGRPHILGDVAQGEDALMWVLRRVPEGTVAMQPARIESDVLNAPIYEGFSETEDFLVYTHLSPTGDYAIQVAEQRAGRTEALRETMQALAVPLILVLLPLSLYFVMWVSKRALRPVDELSAQVAGRDVHDLTPLGDQGLPSELRPIREAVDALLERLRRALEAERSFASNAAHEMRTPIAATLAQTQRLVVEAPEGPLQTRARKIEQELGRIARISEKLLELARAEGGGVLSAELHDLVPILNAVVDEVVPVTGPDRARWSISLPPHLSCHLDPDAFGLLVRNLLQNAVVHGAPTQGVTLALTQSGVLSVANGGPVIAPEVLAKLSTRFERANTRKAGSGLGLAIAESIAQGAGLRLELLSPVPDRDDGFCARVDLGRLM
jgi:two-component system OmpR family sensor kinase